MLSHRASSSAAKVKRKPPKTSRMPVCFTWNCCTSDLNHQFHSDYDGNQKKQQASTTEPTTNWIRIGGQSKASTWTDEDSITSSLVNLPDFKHFLLLGLDGVGKTSLLSRWKSNSQSPCLKAPIKSMENNQLHQEIIRLPRTKRKMLPLKHHPKKGHKMVLVDVGRASFNLLKWPIYCTRSRIGGLFYVIDATKPERLREAAREFLYLIEHTGNGEVPLVFLINKQDLADMRPGDSVNLTDVILHFRLVEISNPWKLMSSSIKTGQNLLESLVAMRKMSKEYRKRIAKIGVYVLDLMKEESAYSSSSSSEDDYEDSSSESINWEESEPSKPVYKVKESEPAGEEKPVKDELILKKNPTVTFG